MPNLDVGNFNIRNSCIDYKTITTRAQKIAEEKRNEAGRLYFELLLKKESERGRFKLKSEVKDTGPVSHPDDSF
jgi:5-hydroxyisourate hydrolase-like protein (transthyretin family)